MGRGYVAQKIKLASSTPVMPSLARQRLAAVRAEEKRKEEALKGRTGLLDFVVEARPGFERPDWLAPYTEVLERAVSNDNATPICCEQPGEQWVVVAAPPQHGKTEVTLTALLWWAKYYPGKRHAYVTYNEDRAEFVSRQFKRLAEEAGAGVEGNLSDLTIDGKTTIRFTSVNGSLTGFPVDGVCIIDDPIKGPVEAQSKKVRARCVEFFDSVAFVRRHKGTSFVIMATRWHPEDLSGVLIKRGWRYINLKAIAEGPVNDDGVVESDPLRRRAGESLWHRKPPSFFDEDRKKPYWWSALFQGEPRPRGGKVFSVDPNEYAKLPAEGYRGAFGLDLAYTQKAQKHAEDPDWSVLVELWRVDTSDKKKPLFYVVDVIRKQVEAPSFGLALKAKRAQHPNWKMRWYAGGTEKGAAQFFRNAGIPINVLPPKGDKFVRATEVAAAWNDGRVLVPDPEHFNCPWLLEFLEIVMNFSGLGEEHDDDVDALGSAYDELMQGCSVKAAGASGSERE